MYEREMVRAPSSSTSLIVLLKGSFLFFVYINNLLMLVMIPSSSAYYFESPCKNSNSCNPSDHTNFICWNAICVCDLNRNLVYDHIQNYCLRPLGGKCKSDKDCMQNAHCDTKTQLCSCSSPHFEATESGECRAKFKQACNDTVECNHEKFLQCSNGGCFCHSAHNLTYDRKKDKCVAELGRLCERKVWMGFQIECESNAECAIVNEKDEFYGKCRCKENFFTGLDACERVVGSPCDKTNESSCQDGLHLRCHRGQCQCMDKAVFDPKYNQCRLKVGSPCPLSLDNQCVSNAECMTKREEEKARCACADGFIESSRGSCKAAYANYCKVDGDCFKEGRCQDERCRCHLGQEYDYQKKSCAIAIGQPCNPQQTHGTQTCVNNAICIPEHTTTNEIINGIVKDTCVCKYPFVPFNGSCVPGLGAPCTISLDYCSKELGFICSGVSDECICNNSLIPDTISNKCKIKAGGLCQLDATIDCTSNSYCGPVNTDSFEKMCVCKPSYKRVPDGRCLLGYGELCKHNICDEYRAFKCINNTCGCESPLVYNESSNYCEATSQIRLTGPVSSGCTCVHIHAVLIFHFVSFNFIKLLYNT